MYLSHFNVGKNKISDQGVRDLLTYIPKTSNITDLILEDNQIGSECMKEMANFLAERERKQYDLGNFLLLHLGGNKIDDNGAAFLAEGLKKCETIMRLHLPYNKLTGIGAKAIVDNLPNQLTVLNLSNSNNGRVGGNKIKDEGVKAIIAKLANKKLEALYLDNCEIPVKEGLELAQKCKELKAVKYLYMRGNFEAAKEEEINAIKACGDNKDLKLTI